MNIIIAIISLFIFINLHPLPVQNQTNLTLWYLSTDNHNQNAKLIQIDLEQQRVVKEVALPADLTVASALWSPDQQLIAAVVVDDELITSSYAKSDLCVFSNTGAMKKCRELSILNMFQQPYNFTPAPVAWSKNSQDLFVVEYKVKDDRQELNILTLNAEQLSVSSTNRVNLDFEEIGLWEWAPDAKRAAVYTLIHDIDYGLYHKFYVIDFFTEPASAFLFEAKGASWPAWSSDQTTLVYDTYIRPDPEAIDPVVSSPKLPGSYKMTIAHWNEKRILTVENFTTPPTFNGNEILPFYTTGVSDMNQIAFADIEYIEEPSPRRRLILYWMDISTSQVFYLSQIENEYEGFRINNLIWAPGGYYLAGEVCDGIGLLGAASCDIGIWTTEGDFIQVVTGYPENRDPQWLTNP